MAGTVWGQEHGADGHIADVVRSRGGGMGAAVRFISPFYVVQDHSPGNDTIHSGQVFSLIA